MSRLLVSAAIALGALAPVLSTNAVLLADQDQIRVGSRVGDPPPSGAAAQRASRPGGVFVPSGYDDGGRRDPFVSLIVPKKPTAGQPARVAVGLAALSVTDVTVKGIIKSGATLLALLEAPDGRTFIARRQDRLHDGLIKGIEPDAVIFIEQVADALGKIRPREVRKTLRASVEVMR